MAVWLGVIAAALAVHIGQLAAILLLEHRRQAYMTAWLFIAMLFPFVGFMAYLLAGRRLRRQIGVQRQHEAHHRSTRLLLEEIGIAGKPAPRLREDVMLQERLLALLIELAPFPITSCNVTQVLTNGEATFAAILEALKQAKHHIHLDYYTIRNDGVGAQFLDVLSHKAREGVEVRIVYDGIGSLNLDRAFLDRLHEAGGRAVCFSPPRTALFKRRINFRNHRKIVVVDGATGFLGGINIGDEYVGLDKKLGYWRDTHLKLQGPAVYDLQQLFMTDWLAVTRERLPVNNAYFPKAESAGEGTVMIVPGNPGMNDQKIVEVLCAAMNAARSTIYITTPYFIPDSALTASLRIAARSGIDVKLIIPGVSDSELVLLATLSHVQDMLEAGVSIFRYERGFIHAKVIIVDSMLASVGTANLDMRSLYSNYELLALLFDERSIRRLQHDFMRDLSDSSPLELETFCARSRKQKVSESIMHMLGPLL